MRFVRLSRQGLWDPRSSPERRSRPWSRPHVSVAGRDERKGCGRRRRRSLSLWKSTRSYWRLHEEASLRRSLSFFTVTITGRTKSDRRSALSTDIIHTLALRSETHLLGGTSNPRARSLITTITLILPFNDFWRIRATEEQAFFLCFFFSPRRVIRALSAQQCK